MNTTTTGARAHRRLPAPTCASCGRPLVQGTRRVVGSPRIRIALWTLQTQLDHLPDRARTARLRDRYRDLFVVVSGLDDRVLDRAVADAQAGLRPWVCQKCDQSICERCGAPWFGIPGADLLEDDGEVLHHGIFPVGDKLCSNAECLAQAKRALDERARAKEWKTR